MIELDAEPAAGLCNQCGGERGVLLVTIDAPYTAGRFQAYICAMCVVGIVDDALGWKLRNQVALSILQRGVDRRVKSLPMVRGGAQTSK